MSEIKPEVRGIADTIKEHMEHDGSGNLTAGKDTYEKTLPEGLDMGTVKKVFSHNENVTSAMTLATGEKGLDILKENKDIDSVSGELKVPRHLEINAGVSRSKVGPASVNDRTEVTRYGSMTTRVKTTAQSSSRTDMKAVRETIAEKAEKLFS